jgi:hypothetical protein
MPIAVEHIDEVTNRDLFFVKDLAKRGEPHFSDKFDVYDAHSKELLIQCREPDVSSWTKLSRMWGKRPVSNVGLDTMPPFNYLATMAEGGQELLRMVRQSSTFSVGGAPVQFFDPNGDLLARMEIVILCMGRKYAFKGPSGELLCMLQMKSGLTRTSIWSEGREVATLTSNWKGECDSFFKERFKYAISIAPDVPKTTLLRNIIFGVGLCYYRVMD